MNLFFLRHGIAVDRDPQSFPDDSRRPLTLKGEDRIRLVCDAIQSLGLNFDHILSMKVSSLPEISCEMRWLKSGS